MDGLIKVGVGDYYLYDLNNNLIGVLKAINKGVFSCNCTGCGYDINLLNVKIDLDLLSKIKQLDKIEVVYRFSENGSNIKDTYFTLQNARVENYKIVSKKNDCAVINLKISVTSIDNSVKKNIDLYTDYICLSINDTLIKINQIWNDLSNEQKLDIYNSIIKYCDYKFSNDINQFIYKDKDNLSETRSGFGNQKIN
jgi:hypothetical protein